MDLPLCLYCNHEYKSHVSIAESCDDTWCCCTCNGPGPAFGGSCLCSDYSPVSNAENDIAALRYRLAAFTSSDRQAIQNLSNELEKRDATIKLLLETLEQYK